MKRVAFNRFLGIMLGASIGFFFAAPSFGVSPVYFLLVAFGTIGLMFVESIVVTDAGRKHSVRIPD